MIEVQVPLFHVVGYVSTFAVAFAIGYWWRGARQIR